MGTGEEKGKISRFPTLQDKDFSSLLSLAPHQVSWTTLPLTSQPKWDLGRESKECPRKEDPCCVFLDPL